MNNALGSLYRMNFYGVLLDLAALKVREKQVFTSSVDRASWHDGYIEAIEDIFNFVDVYMTPKVSTEKVAADFGALTKLVETKEITEDERDFLRRK